LRRGVPAIRTQHDNKKENKQEQSVREKEKEKERAGKMVFVSKHI